MLLYLVMTREKTIFSPLLVSWKEWRQKIFERDNYTCQECGNRGCYIEPHYIYAVDSMLKSLEDLYGKVTDKLLGRHELLFSTKNGITLCRSCHMKTMRKEKQFESQYALAVNTR